MNNQVISHLGTGFKVRSNCLILLTLFCCLGAISRVGAQQTVQLLPQLPKIVVGANFTNAGPYTVPVTVLFGGGNAAVNLAVTGVPAGATATFDTNNLTGSGTANLL